MREVGLEPTTHSPLFVLCCSCNTSYTFFTIALPAELLSHNKRLFCCCLRCLYAYESGASYNPYIRNGNPMEMAGALYQKNFSKFTTFNFSVLNQTHTGSSRGLFMLLHLCYSYLISLHRNRRLVSWSIHMVPSTNTARLRRRRRSLELQSDKQVLLHDTHDLSYSF